RHLFRDFGDVRLRHFARRQIAFGEGERAGADRLPASLVGRQRLRSFPGPHGAGLAAGMPELNSGYGSLGFDETRDAREGRRLFVVPEAETGGRDAPSRLDMGGLGEDDAHAADGARSEMHEAPVVRNAVPGAVLAHRRKSYPVARRDAAERHLLQKKRVWIAPQNTALVLAHRMMPFPGFSLVRMPEPRLVSLLEPLEALTAVF